MAARSTQTGFLSEEELVNSPGVPSEARRRKGTVAVIVDTTRSMTHKGSDQSRYTQMEQLLRGQLLPELRRTSAVRLYDMSGRPTPELPPTPTLERTDIAEAVRNTMAHLAGDLVAGVHP